MGLFIEDAIYKVFPSLKPETPSTSVTALQETVLFDEAVNVFVTKPLANLIQTGINKIRANFFGAVETMTAKLKKTVNLDVKWIGQYLGKDDSPPKGVPPDCKYATARMINRYMKHFGLPYFSLPEAIPNSPIIKAIDPKTRGCKNSKGSLNTNRTEAAHMIKMIDAYLDKGLPVATLVNIYGRKSDGTDHWVAIVGREYSATGKVRYKILDPGRGSKSDQDYFEIEESSGNLVKFIDGEKKRYRGGTIVNASYEVFGIFPHKERSQRIALR